MFLGEFKRVFLSRVNKILFSCLILLALLLSGLAIFSTSYVNKEGETETGFFATRKLIKDKQAFSGELSPKIFNDIVSLNESQLPTNKLEPAESIQASEDILAFINKVIVGENEYDAKAYTKVSTNQIANLYERLESNHKQIERDYGKTEKKRRFIHNQFQKESSPLIYEPADSFKTMSLYATTYAIILVVTIGFIASNLFAEEFTLRSYSVFFSTRFGQTKAISRKLLTGLVSASLIYIVGMTILSFTSFSVMGISGYRTSYLIENPNSIYVITYGQMYLLIVLSGFIASLLSASAAMCVSAITKSAPIATCVPFFLFVVSPFLSRLAPNSTFFQLTPDNLINLMNGINIPLLFQIGSFVFTQTTFIIVFYCVLSLLLIPITYTLYKRSGVYR